MNISFFFFWLINVYGFYIKNILLLIDSDTRRRAAADLIRGLMERFEAQVTGIMSQYINLYLEVRTIKFNLFYLFIYLLIIYETQILFIINTYLEI